MAENLKFLKADLSYTFNTIHLVKNLKKFVKEMHNILSDLGLCLVGWNLIDIPYSENKPQNISQDIIDTLLKYFKLIEWNCYLVKEEGHEHIFLYILLRKL